MMLRKIERLKIIKQMRGPNYKTLKGLTKSTLISEGASLGAHFGMFAPVVCSGPIVNLNCGHGINILGLQSMALLTPTPWKAFFVAV